MTGAPAASQAPHGRSGLARRAALLLAPLLIALALLAPHADLRRQVFDGIVVLDITQSMNTLDVQLGGRPASRLAFARAGLHRALAQLPCGSRVGWGVFTEYRSYVLLKPVEVCANYSDLSSTLDRIDGGMAWAGGSQITRGLLSALRISAHMPEHPAIVFVTDGHEAPPVRRDFSPAVPDDVTDPRGMIVGVGGDTLRPIPKFDPIGRPIGVWGPEDVLQAPLRESSDAGRPDAEFAPTGTEHLSSLKQAHLQQMAALTGLGYARLDTDTPMAGILQDAHATRSLRVSQDLRAALTALALALLLAGIGPKRRLPRVPVPRWARGRVAARTAHRDPAAAQSAGAGPGHRRLSRT